MSGSAAGTVEQLATELSLVFAPLARRQEDGSADQLLDWVGLRSFDAAAGSNRLLTALAGCVGAAANMPEAVAALLQAIEADDATAVAAALGPLLKDFGAAVQSMRDAADALRELSTDPSLTTEQRAEVTAVADEFVTRVLGRLLVDYLEGRFPAVAVALTVTGVIEVTPTDAGAADDSLAGSYLRKTFHFDRLVRLFSDPGGLLREAYHWGEPDFDGLALFTALRTLLSRRYDIPAEILRPPGEPALLEAFGFSAEVDPSLSPPGLTINLRAPAGISRSETFTEGDWQVTIDTSATFGADIEGTLRPLFDLQLTAAAGSVDVAIGVSLARSATAEPFLLLGSAGGSRLELRGPTAGFGVHLHFDTSNDRVVLDPELSIGLHGLKLVISAEGGDGFIATLLSGTRLESDVDTELTWSSSQGARFTGSGTLVIALPVHLDLGPVEVQAAYLAAGLTGGGTVPIELSAGIGAELGPIQASVDRVGALATLSFPAGGGNLGPADLAFAFKPPTLVGLALDAGVVKGGGFLAFDPGAGEYSGGLQLEFADFLQITAIGLITTRMPDGSKGFSLLLVLTAEFPGGLQLGFGFKLIGVGGVIGLNRGMQLRAIMEGVRTGAIESVMFPQDIVKNAPRIISDLKAFFPPQDGMFVIGPMAKLGWGTPTVVSVSLGLIIEIPGNIAVVGVLKAALPEPDDPVLLLQVNFAGAIEFDTRRLYFFASVYDSRILTLTIEGELGLLVAYGDQPDFVITVGGFHPAFTPPPLPFPVPRRVSLNIVNTDVIRLGVDGYFAITSNTVQFGANAQLAVHLSAFALEGYLGFDALIQIPFQFVISLRAGASVKVFGIGLFSVSLDLTLSGPTPWHAWGTASVSVLFFSIPIRFDETWGEDRQITFPPVDALAALIAELNKPESWRTRAPDPGSGAGSSVVSLRQLPEAEADVVLHPLGSLVVHQRAVPLDIRLDRIGNQPTGDVRRCSTGVDTPGLRKVDDATDKFALAQYQDLSDAERLSLPAYESQHAGVELGSDGTAMASRRAVRRNARHEQLVIDSVDRRHSRFVNPNQTLFNHFLAGSSTARSPLSQAERNLRQPFDDAIAVTDDAYVVASTRDNTQQGPVFASQAQARSHLEALLAAEPNRIDTLHVIPAAELAA